MLFDETMTAHVDMLVRRQKEVGIDVVSDGETSRYLMRPMSKIATPDFRVIARVMRLQI